MISDLLKGEIPAAAARERPAGRTGATGLVGDAAGHGAAGTQATPASGNRATTGCGRRRRPTPGSATITGQWVGTLRQPGTTETLGCDLHVAASGRPLWAFNDTDGFHKTELTHAGQKLQYVPPERGVVTVIVHSVTGSPAETGYVVDYAFERSSNGYLTQRYERIAMSGRLRGAQLDVTYSVQGLSSFGDKTGLAAGAETAEYRGSLTKQA